MARRDGSARMWVVTAQLTFIFCPVLVTSSSAWDSEGPYSHLGVNARPQVTQTRVSVPAAH